MGNYPARHSKEFYGETVASVEAGFHLMFDALGVDAHYSAVKPAPPSVMVGMGKAPRRALEPLFRRVLARAEAEGFSGDAGLFDSFNRFVDVLNEEAVQSGFLVDAVEALLGCKLGAASAAVCDEFQLDVIVKSGILVPEGVVLVPKAFASRWEEAVGKEMWMEYFGEGNVRLVAYLAAMPAQLQDARTAASGWEDSDSEEETAAMTDD